jgi:hypothetical protein
MSYSGAADTVERGERRRRPSCGRAQSSGWQAKEYAVAVEERAAAALDMMEVRKDLGYGTEVRMDHGVD